MQAPPRPGHPYTPSCGLWVSTHCIAGAQPGEVLRSVVGRTLALVAMGLLLGIPLAAGASRVGQGLLVGVELASPTTYAIAGGLLTVVALAASWLPARRAASVDPIAALRVE